ncbi:MAG: YhbY family RNA-binding protein, partial [Candidatus Bathyarchaeota archaeon]
SKQLEKTGMVKVKILKAALGKTPAKLMAYNIASQTGATLIDTRGHTFILYKGKTEK